MGATSLQEVSVYTTYNMVAVALTSLLSVFFKRHNLKLRFAYFQQR